MAILGIDAGNYETKICVNEQVFSFPSDIGEYRDLKWKDDFSKDGFVWEYNGDKGFGGSLAKYESEYGGTFKGTSKAHPEVVLRVLFALHKYGDEENKIIVGQPIKAHKIEEKEKFKKLLKGEHVLKINDVEKKIIISEVEIAPEGLSAILSNPVKGMVRIIDIGSGTTNFGTLDDFKKIDKGSFTRQIGTEIMLNKDYNEMAKGLAKIVSGKWKRGDRIYLTGGGADKVYEYLKNNYFWNCQVLKPRLGNSLLNTRYANAVGFYTIAKGVFKNEEHQSDSNSIQHG